MDSETNDGSMSPFKVGDHVVHSSWPDRVFTVVRLNQEPLIAKDVVTNQYFQFHYPGCCVLAAPNQIAAAIARKLVS